ncbi:MAG: glycoside hydrolase family 1 protein [Candidatus Omnitrophica bacterium]|nr:glycoside hydrolase family 1 protein [Candidatus Omnitrophota bacterium]
MTDRFPEDFLWGAATSSHQVEGNNFYNDWWKWERSGGTEASNLACDHYNRFKEDFSLAKELNHNAHRVGLEWSRLEKDENVWDRGEWDHYKEVIDELLALGIEPVVTLNHFTVPLWLSLKGSWLCDESVEFFTRFAEKAIEHLGSRVQYWITINEPNILAILAYFFGEWTPCEKDFGKAMLVLKNMLKSHASAYRVMHEAAENNNRIKAPKVGIAKAVTAFHPCSPYSPRDRLVTWLRSKLHNYSFVNSALKGKVLIPGLKQEKLAARGAADFIGLNYYFRQFIGYHSPFREHPLGEVCDVGHHKDAGPVTDMGWEIYPKGLYEVIKSFSRYKLPIIISENGIATRDDPLRQKYIKDHLSYVLKAISEGSPVFGYLHWSLMDNFEWAHGYSKKFGLIEVDFDSQKRTIRDSGRYLGKVIKTGKIAS